MDLRKLARYKEILLRRTESKEPKDGYDSAVRPKGQDDQSSGPQAIIGIDIGNQSGCAAQFKNGSINQIGSRFSAEFCAPVVDRAGVSSDVLIARAVKSRIDANLRFTLDNLTYNPSGLYQVLLERLKPELSEATGCTSYKCVLTVPLAFDANQRRLVKKAAEKAGYDVLQLINEPTAVGFYYCYNTSKNGRYIVVSGGSATYGVIAFEFANGAVRVLCGSGETNFGADDFDICLAQSLQSDIAQTPRTKTGGIAIAEPMRQACEEVRLQLERRDDFANQYVSISKQQYMQCTKRLSAKLKSHITDVLTESKTDLSNFDGVLIAGGFANSFIVRDAIEATISPTLKRIVLPLESAAYGAAVQAHLLAKG